MEKYNLFLSVASYSTMFTTAVSYFDPNFKSSIFINNTESSRIMSRKEIWRIIRGGQSNNIISEATDMSAGRRSGV